MRSSWGRIYQSTKFIPALTLLAVVSLLLSTYSVVQYAQAQSQRETDRVTADVASCERGNVLRAQVAALGAANNELITGILDVVLVTDAGLTIRADLEPLLDEYRSVIASIVLVDCQALTPGAKGN